MVASGFAATIGLEVTHADGDEVRGRLPLAPVTLGADGGLHPGAVSTVVETLASVGAALWLGERGQVVGVTNATEFLAAPAAGTVAAVARPLLRGEDAQLWSVVLTLEGGHPGQEHGRDGQDGQVVADGRVRLQNLRGRSGARR